MHLRRAALYRPSSNDQGRHMTSDRRSDLSQSGRIEAAVQIDLLWGCASAWRYLRSRGTARAVAMRVLGGGGPRRRLDFRHSDNVHPHPRVIDGRISQRTASAAHSDTGAAMPRKNVAAACAVERALELAAADSGQYAHSLLLIYGLSTTTIVRVLFEPGRRRHAASRTTQGRPTPAAGIR
jgi:hypothetical protein